jgi:transcriptional regulator with XRE-family HTH domain
MKSFGEIMKTERENNGLILRKVASALDIDQAIVSKFEKGDRIVCWSRWFPTRS